MIWVGLDLHRRYITACALDDGGGRVAEHGRLPTAVDGGLACLHELGGPVTVAMEATLYWGWLHDRLGEAGIAAVVAHPYQ
jgi:transposase